MTLPNSQFAELATTTAERININRFGRLADALNQRIPIARVNVTDVPVGVAEGDVLLVAATGATGALTGFDGRAALLLDSGWISLGSEYLWHTTSGDYAIATPGANWTQVAGSGGGGAAAITVSDEGTTLTSAPVSMNFTGAGVTTSSTVGGAVTVLIPGSNAAALAIADEGTNLTTAATGINFVGAGVTTTNVGGAVTVTIPGGGTATALTTQDEGVSLTTSTASLNFTGAGVTATNTGNAVTIDIPSGGAAGPIGGHKTIYTTGTVDANGEIGGTTTLSIHQNDRDGNLLPLAGLLSGSILSIYDEGNPANYINWTLTANLTLAGSIYSATATRVNGGAIVDGANARLVIAPRGANGVSGISGVTIALNGADVASAITRINFVGTNYTITSPSVGQVNVSVAAGGGGGTSSGDAVLATAFFRTNGDSNTNDGTNVSALTSLGVSSFTISQSTVANQPTLTPNAFGSLAGWTAIDTGSDSTRDSFNISPSLSLPPTGWTVIIAGTITGNTQALASTANSHNITLPNGGAITVDTSSGQAVSNPLTRTFPTTYVWTVVYDGTQYLFYEGLNARGSQAQNGSLTFNSIGQIQSNIRRLDCRLGTIVCWDTLLSATDREAAVNALATRYGITL